MRLRVLVGTAVGIVLLLAGYLVADAADLVPGVLTRHNRYADLPTFLDSAAGKAAYQRSGTFPRSADVAPAIAGAGPMPTGPGLEAALHTQLTDPALGPAPGVLIRDATTGSILLQRHADVQMTPASSTKVLAAAGLAVGSPLEARIPTKAVLSGPQAITLVGAGDTLLGEGADQPAAVVGRAGLGTLADLTAAALRTRGVTSATLAVDDTFAAGPRLGPGWAHVDVAQGLTSPITVLALAKDRATPGNPSSSDPPLRAARAFADALTSRGLRITGTPIRATAPPTAPVLGTVHSATVREQLTFALAESDNALTELLARRGAHLAGRGTDFPSVTGWLREQAATLGVDLSQAVMVDASGLSRGTLLTPRIIADLVQVGAKGTNPALTSVLAGLPIAGLTGTLKERFTAPPADAAAGVARAKTGTLTGASSLAGFVTTADGRLLTYALVADHVGGTREARRALDAVVAGLARCGCR